MLLKKIIFLKTIVSFLPGDYNILTFNVINGISSDLKLRVKSATTDADIQSFDVGKQKKTQKFQLKLEKEPEQKCVLLYAVSAGENDGDSDVLINDNKEIKYCVGESESDIVSIDLTTKGRFEALFLSY